MLPVVYIFTIPLPVHQVFLCGRHDSVANLIAWRSRALFREALANYTDSGGKWPIFSVELSYYSADVLLEIWRVSYSHLAKDFRNIDGGWGFILLQRPDAEDTERDLLRSICINGYDLCFPVFDDGFFRRLHHNGDAGNAKQMSAFFARRRKCGESANQEEEKNTKRGTSPKLKSRGKIQIISILRQSSLFTAEYSTWRPSPPIFINLVYV